MKFMLGLSLLFPIPNPIVVKQNHIQNIKVPTICVEDIECELPYRCCTGILFNYCCTGGYGAPIPKSRFPNITVPKLPVPKLPVPKLPDNFPLPVPRRSPKPVLIPIPIEPDRRPNRGYDYENIFISNTICQK